MKQRNVAGMKFGTGKRDATNPTDSPSPAEYDPEMIRRGIMFSKSGSTNIKFGTARNDESKPCSKPGPAVSVEISIFTVCKNDEMLMVVLY